MSYERLTKKADVNLLDCEYSCGSLHLEVIKRLGELEDKIENGTLIELPRMFRDLSNLGWYVEWLDETGCAIHCHFQDKAEAEKKLKERQNER